LSTIITNYSPLLSQAFSNHFTSLATEKENVPDENQQAEGWADAFSMRNGWGDDISIHSSSSPKESQKERAQGKPTQEPVKTIRKKRQKLKNKIPKHPKHLGGPEQCQKEAAQFGALSSLSSLQSAALKIGFPVKYMQPVSLVPSLGRGLGPIFRSFS
jgi:hypothetical protein